MALIGEATLLTYLYFKKKRAGGGDEKEKEEAEENKQDRDEEKEKQGAETAELPNKVERGDELEETEGTEKPEMDITSKCGSESSPPTEDQPTGTSRWRSLVAKSSLALNSSRESVAANAAVKKEAAALKLKEAGDSITSSANSASEKVTVKSTTATSSINASFWNVVQLAQKVRAHNQHINSLHSTVVQCGQISCQPLASAYSNLLIFPSHALTVKRAGSL